MHRRYLPTFCKGFFLIVSAALFVKPATAKQEVVVMVNGPWAYVADPDPNMQGRLVVIAPQSGDHAPPVIFSGADATQFANKFSVVEGKYVLEINNLDRASCSSPPPASSYSTYPLNNVGQAQVAAAVHSKTRYAFSLPAPCYVTAEPGYYGHSRIDPNKPPDKNTPDVAYNMWLVLHYYVTNVDSAVLNGQSDDQTVTYTNRPIGFTMSNGRSDWGISISMASAVPDTNRGCDSTSAAAATRAAALFGQTIHVRMPGIDNNGNQTTTYDYTCPANVIAAAMLVHNAKLVLKKIKTVQTYLDSAHASLKDAKAAFHFIQEALNPLAQDLPTNVKKELSDVGIALDRAELSKAGSKAEKQASKTKSSDDLPTLNGTKDYVTPFVVGSTDCRGAQLSVNSAP
jgi:hypothetical protein